MQFKQIEMSFAIVSTQLKPAQQDINFKDGLKRK